MSDISRRYRGPVPPNIQEMMGPFEILDPRPKLGFHPIRVKERFEGATYVLSAELPGFRPEDEIELVVAGGTLTILAERSEAKPEEWYSEFLYGSFRRSVRLPDGADEDQISASYTDGILTVTVPLKHAVKDTRRTIAVKRGA